MPNFLLEIGTEEMPARFLPSLAAALKDLFESRLASARLEYDSVRTFVTPRRLTAFVEKMADKQPVTREIVTGPPVRAAYDADGNPTKAAVGFARSHGVDVEATFAQMTDKGEYLAVQKKVGGAKAGELLPDMCRAVISGLPFPKKMRWEAGGFTFGRPIRWLAALLDGEVVPFELAGVKTGRETSGHRIMGPGPWKIPSADAYFGVVAHKGHVTLDAGERKEKIRLLADRAVMGIKAEIAWSESLLDEVANLGEYPRPILGRFEDKFLKLPREVLLTSMEKHQKSFGVQNAQGELLPYFISVLNLEPKDLDLVVKGWERVLKARLEDARFFWEADSRRDFAQWLAELENVIYLAPLGTMGDKSRRLESVCRFLARKLCPEDADHAARAGRLAKADLVSEMVGEFDTLQGIMGGIYAGQKGESEVVARAVYEQYLPSGPDTPVPQTLCGAILSMADKADALAGCFGLNKIPTGAYDPYALRRSALGICRIVLEFDLDLDLAELLTAARKAYSGADWKIPEDQALDKLLDFFSHRLKAYFQGQGYETRIVDAAIGAGFRDVKNLAARLRALEKFSREKDFDQAVLTFKRAANIIYKQGGEAGGELNGRFDKSLLEEPQEKALAGQLEQLAPEFEDLWAKGKFNRLFALLRDLRPGVDSFFDHVMVMCDDKALRLNRMNLLFALVEKLSRLADFSALQV